MPNSQKGFAAIFILLIAAIVIIGLVFIGYKKYIHVDQPLKLDKQKNQIYKNDQFGFQFEYDKDSFITQGYKGKDEELIFGLGNDQINNQFKRSEKFPFFSLKVYQGDLCRFVSLTKKTIDSISASYTEASGINTNEKFIKACFIKNSFGYYFESVTYDETSFNLARGIFNQIITSFKFTKQLSSNIFRRDGNLYEISANNPPQLLKSGITNYWVSPNNDYVIYSLYVGEAGAGKIYDYWVLNLSTKEATDLSKMIKNNKDYKERYADKNLDRLFLVIRQGDKTWAGNSPVFQVADGWEILPGKTGEGDWIYNLDSKEFELEKYFINREISYTDLAIKKKGDTQKVANANRAFAHFRW